MTIYKALKKIDTLTKYELKHFIQLVDIEIVHGYKYMENYPPDRMKKYGIPYIKRLEEKKQKFIDQMKKL